MSGDEGLLVWGDVELERDRLVFGGDLVAAQSQLDLFDRNVEALRDEWQIDFGVFDLLAQGGSRRRRDSCRR